MEEDGASEIGDWEVLSAASGYGGGADDADDEVLVVSGGGGNVRHDHFALAPGAGSPGEAPWSEPGDAWQGVESLDGFEQIPRASFDLAAGVWREQLPTSGGVDEAARQGSILEATVAPGVTWGTDGSQADGVDGEIDQESMSNAVIDHGELGSLLPPAHHSVGETLDSDAATPTGALPRSEAFESSPVELDGGEIDAAGVESSCPEDAMASDGIHGEQEEQEQGGDADAASHCDEPGSEAKDGALPLAHTAGAEEGDKQVVWWRLPFRLLHYCAWKVKPVWSFSIAAALLGLVVLGRRMYRMRHKARGLPQIKIAFDDKRASQFADRTARLNEAFLVARRVPLLRTSSGAVLPWSMVQER